MPSKHNIPPELEQAYQDLVDAVPEIQQKGKNNPYTSLNGHMFSFLAKEGYIAIRLPKDEFEAFIETYDAEQAISYGAKMREYVAVPNHMANQTELLAGYLRKSHAYIQTLKPKPTTKKKS